MALLLELGRANQETNTMFDFELTQAASPPGMVQEGVAQAHLKCKKEKVISLFIGARSPTTCTQSGAATLSSSIHTAMGQK